MALTSLVVCADLKAVQVLSQILRELNIEAEHCADLAQRGRPSGGRAFRRGGGRLPGPAARHRTDCGCAQVADQPQHAHHRAGGRTGTGTRYFRSRGQLHCVQAGFRGAGGKQPAGGARSDGTGKANQTEDRSARTGVDYLRQRGECGGHAAGLERGWTGHPVRTPAASTLQGLLSI